MLGVNKLDAVLKTFCINSRALYVERYLLIISYIFNNNLIYIHILTMFSPHSRNKRFFTKQYAFDD